MSTRPLARRGGCRRGEAVRDRGGFDPVLGVELSQDVRDVDAGGLDADHQRGGDLAVGVAAGDQAEDLGLARCQPEQLPEPGILVGRLARRFEVQPWPVGIEVATEAVPAVSRSGRHPQLSTPPAKAAPTHRASCNTEPIHWVGRRRPSPANSGPQHSRGLTGWWRLGWVRRKSRRADTPVHFEDNNPLNSTNRFQGVLPTERQQSHAPSARWVLV